MIIHGGNWNAQSGDSNLVAAAAADLANAGYFAVSVWYELAPPDYIPGQPCWPTPDPSATPTPGTRMIVEVNDIKALVGALRADSRCNGKIGVVGGSAGATHAVTVALDMTRSCNGTCNGSNDVWPWWFKDGIDSRPDCAVMLSAIYDFSDWTPPNFADVTDPGFVKDGLANYAQTLDLDTLANLPLNPVAIVHGLQRSDFKPLFLINSWCDSPVAYHQIVTMSCALETQGLVFGTDYQRRTVNVGHAFAYWGVVKQQVIDFLDAHLKVSGTH